MKRLDKLLSDAGVAGRRELKQMIRQGRVQVDGRTVTVPEEKFDEKTAVVTGRNPRFWIFCLRLFVGRGYFRWAGWTKIPPDFCF